MPQCVYCNGETELYDSGVPVCPPCCDTLQSKREASASDQQAGTVLHREVIDARERAKAASTAFTAIIGEVPSGIPRTSPTNSIFKRPPS